MIIVKFSIIQEEKDEIDLFEWIKIINSTKVGEIILSSIDNDGMNSILNSEILKKIRNKIDLPLIYSGGISNNNDIYKLKILGYDGVCIGSCLHYDKIKLNKIKSKL